MNKTLVSAVLAVLFVSVVANLSVAADPPAVVPVDTAAVVVDAPVASPCCPAPCCPPPRFCRPVRFCLPAPPCCDPVVCKVPCVKAVAKRGAFGHCRTVYVPCCCDCCKDGCCDDCTGCVKVVRVGCRLMKARICTCECCAAPDAANN